MAEQNLSGTASMGPVVADNVTALLAYWDNNMVCRFANAAYVKWFGKKPDDIINKITIPELLGKELFEKNLPYILGALAGEPQCFEREVPLPSGVTYHSIANYIPKFSEDGQVEGFFVHVADVSPIKELEKELVESNKIITEQNNRLLNFANIVSHNLKTYAGNLEAVLELYTTTRSTEEKAEMLGFLKSISTGFTSTINHLNEIVDAQNKKNLKNENVNLYEYIEKVLKVLNMQLRQEETFIKNDVAPNVFININPAYLESILLNLISNAIKYKHPKRHAVVELSFTEQDRESLLQVRDNGLGIDMEKNGDKLFGMYKTFHGNDDAKGIGLFITKFQVVSMGGRIEAESVENEGTTFKIFLPK